MCKHWQLPEVLDSNLSTHMATQTPMWQLTTICNCSSGGSDAITGTWACRGIHSQPAGICDCCYLQFTLKSPDGGWPLGSSPWHWNHHNTVDLVSTVMVGWITCLCFDFFFLSIYVVFVFAFSDRILHVVQGGLEHMMPLPLLSQGWYYTFVLLDQAL